MPQGILKKFTFLLFELLDALLDGPFGNHTVNKNTAILADSMHAVDSLIFDGRRDRFTLSLWLAAWRRELYALIEVRDSSRQRASEQAGAYLPGDHLQLEVRDVRGFTRYRLLPSVPGSLSLLPVGVSTNQLPPPDPKTETLTPAQPVAIQPGGIALHWTEGHTPIVAANGDPSVAGEQVTLALRPEKLNISKTKPEAPPVLSGAVIDIAYLGNLSTYYVELDNGTMVKVQMTNARRIARRDITWEDKVWVSWSGTAGVVLST